jgi:hypothetical protein
MVRKRITTGFAGALVAVFMASPVAAQICAGYAAMPGQTAIGLRASFPTGGTQIGVEGARNWNNPLAAFANVNLLIADEDDVDNTPVFGVGFAYEVTEFIPALPAWLSVCPVAGATIAAGDATSITIPLGVGFGTTFGTGEGFTVNPFVIPQFQFVRVSLDDVNVTDSNFGIGFGALLRFGGVYAGATLGRQFIDNAEFDITFHGGLTIPAMIP